MSVKIKTIYITLAITLIAFVYYMSDQWYQYTRNSELLHKEQINIIENYYNNFPMRIVMMMRSSVEVIKSDKDIMKAFRESDQASLNQLTKRYYSYMDMVFSKSEMVINYIKPNGDVIYRAHKPDAFGDNVSDRKMISQGIKTWKPVRGIETGRDGLYLRHLEPISENGVKLGFIEAGVQINFFAKRINNIAGIKTLVLLDSEYSHYYDKSLPDVRGVTAYYNNTGLPLDIFMKRFRGKEGISYVQLGEKDFEIVKQFALIDFKGDKIGEYVFFAERSSLHKWFKKHMIFNCIVGLLGIIVITFIVRQGLVKSVAELEEKHELVRNELVLTNASLEERIYEEVEENRQKDQIINQQKKVADMGQMLSAVSHHWRQPINAIGLYIQDIMDAYKSGELNEEYIVDFEKNNMYLLKKLSDSIDMYKSFYKPSSGEDDFLVSDVLCDIASLLDSKIQSERIDLLFSADCSDLKFDFKKLSQIEKCGCKSLLLHGPLNEFRQSIMNIIYNSIDAIKESGTDTGVIKIFIAERNDELLLNVIDNGAGISEANIDKVFNPFFSTKDEGQGMGVGLYMAKTVIERHMGGKLTVASQNGETCFRITLKKV